MKRHREKRGFRLVPPLARAVQHDRKWYNTARSAHKESLITKTAFTMAEILLSLTIIGVVAAITLPSLTGNINERTWNTQRKALYARFSQAIALMPNLNGYGSTDTDAAETFITAGLAKVLKTNNICDNTHLQDCGIPANYTTMNGSKKSFPTTLSELNPCFTSVDINEPETSQVYKYSHSDTNAAALETANGESIAVFYRPDCQADLKETGRIYVQNKICAHFVYDLNGTKGPNTVGKDIGFITALYPTDSVVVAPIPHQNDASDSVKFSDAAKTCTQQDSEYRVPSVHELISMFASQLMIGNLATGGYQPSTLIKGPNNNELLVYRLNIRAGSLDYTNKDRYSYRLRCVKR